MYVRKCVRKFIIYVKVEYIMKYINYGLLVEYFLIY